MQGIKYTKKFFIVFGILFFASFALSALAYEVILEPEVTSIFSIETQQQTYKELYNEYQQVQRVGDFEVNVYESVNGKGYQVVEYLDDAINYYGYGSDSEEFSKTISLLVDSATSSVKR